MVGLCLLACSQTCIVFKECIKRISHVKDTSKRLFLCMASRWRTTELVHMGDAWSPPDTFSCYSGARIPLCYRLLIEVSQQDEEHQEEPREKCTGEPEKKKNWLLFFLLLMDLECFQILRLALYTKEFAMRVIPICIIWNNVG